MCKRLRKASTWLKRALQIRYGLQLLVALFMGGMGCLGLAAWLISWAGGEPDWGALGLGVVLLPLAFCIARSCRKHHRTLMAAMDGDAAADVEVDRQTRRGVQWVWRINGAMVTPLCLLMAIAPLAAMSEPWWQRLLMSLVGAALFVAILTKTIRAWRRPMAAKTDASENCTE